MDVQVTMVKCACPDCVCVVDVNGAVQQDGRPYCSNSCAEHHKDGAGCHHAGCICKG